MRVSPASRFDLHHEATGSHAASTLFTLHGQDGISLTLASPRRNIIYAAFCHHLTRRFGDDMSFNVKRNYFNEKINSAAGKVGQTVVLYLFFPPSSKKKPPPLVIQNDSAKQFTIARKSGQQFVDELTRQFGKLSAECGLNRKRPIFPTYSSFLYRCSDWRQRWRISFQVKIPRNYLGFFVRIGFSF
jgi:hypothetical protein